MKHEVRIYCRIKDYVMIRRMRESLGMPQYMTVNGTTDCEVDDDTLERLKRGEKAGYIEIRRCKPKQEL